MENWNGNRWYDELGERLAWHLFTLSVLGLLLLVLLISVEHLGERPSVDAASPIRTAVPVEPESEPVRATHSSFRAPPGTRIQPPWRPPDWRALRPG